MHSIRWSGHLVYQSWARTWKSIQLSHHNSWFMFIYLDSISLRSFFFFFQTIFLSACFSAQIAGPPTQKPFWAIVSTTVIIGAHLFLWEWLDCKLMWATSSGGLQLDQCTSSCSFKPWYQCYTGMEKSISFSFKSKSFLKIHGLFYFIVLKQANPSWFYLTS